MAELNDTEKAFVVRELACMESHARVIEAVKETFDKEVTFAQVRIYDPESPYFEASDKWREVHALERKAFVEQIEQIPVANQSWRLRKLQKGIASAEKMKNWKLVAELMEQAAKEVGGVLTNQRHVSIDGRGKARDLTPEERRETLLGFIDEAVAASQGKVKPEQGNATVN